MKFNQNAIIFWVFTTCVGWLCGGHDLQSAIFGLTVGLGVSLLVEIFL